MPYVQWILEAFALFALAAGSYQVGYFHGTAFNLKQFDKLMAVATGKTKNPPFNPEDYT